MKKDIQELIDYIKKYFSKNFNGYYSFNQNGRVFFIDKREKGILKGYFNKDYSDLAKYEHKKEKCEFEEQLKIYLIENGENNFLFIDIDYEEGYFSTISFENKYPFKDTCFFYISGLLKYFYIDREKKSLKEELTIEYLQKNGYQELTPELGETELDIVGGEFMPYDAWIEKAKDLYKESYIDDNFYYIDEMNWPKSDKERIEPNREKDFEAYCKKEYEGPYTVKHLLFGESFIGELS